MTDNRPRNTSKSAIRALAVLEFLASSGPARSYEIADALGAARSSTDQLLKSLVAEGYLIKTSLDKRYMPSLRVTSFARGMCDGYPSLEVWDRIMTQLFRETGESVGISMENDCFMQVIANIHPAPDELSVKVGTMIPIVGSAMGSAALAAKPQDQVERIVYRARRKRAVMTSAGDGRLMVDIGSYRAQGYAGCQTDWSAYADQPSPRLIYWSIALNLPGFGDSAVTLAVGGPIARVRPNEYEILKLMRSVVSSNLAAHRSSGGTVGRPV